SGCYLLPKSDGRVLVGASMEEAGFDKQATLGVLYRLAEAVQRLVPALKDASFESAWAGLRPGNPDNLPFIGPVQGRPGLILATGHFRKGILMAPITGRIVEALVTGAKPQVDLRPFDPARHHL
ncbi:MAG: FAD-dependent oxidoreductase, partial [Actinobacteria bacterium]|nr:FAD-dependent oxidoreductase [Actinomycetota bacterium]